MIKVIETNLSLQCDDSIIDHQSRVVEIDNWDNYINEFKECKAISRNSIIGCLNGYTLSPKISEIKNLKYDDFHLSCDVYIGNYKSKKLAYKSLV